MVVGKAHALGTWCSDRSRQHTRPTYRLRTDGAADSRPETWAPGTSFAYANARFTPDGQFVFANVRGNEARFIPWRPDQPATTVDTRAVTSDVLGRFFSRDGRRLCGVGTTRDSLTCHNVTAAPDGSLLLGPPSVQFGGVRPMHRSLSKIGAIARDGRFLLATTDEADELDWQLLTDWTRLLPRAAN